MLYRINPMLYSILEQEQQTLYYRKHNMPAIHEITKIVTDFCCLTIEELCQDTRKERIVVPRQITHYMCMKYVPDSNMDSVGLLIGRKDRNTVRHSCKTIQNRMDTDQGFHNFVSTIEDQIRKKYKL
jgi:chromosomal replication initiator protein